MEKIAVFDFDGTLYKHDSLIRFCLFVYKKYPFRIRFFFLQLYYWILYKVGKIDTTQFKSSFLVFIKGMDYSSLEEVILLFWGREKVHLRDSLLIKMERNREENITNVCLTASPEIFLKPIQQQLSLNLIGTKLVNVNGEYRIKGKNCRGEEKINRLKNHFSDKGFEMIYAVSDNEDDKKLLAMAQKFDFIS